MSSYIINIFCENFSSNTLTQVGSNEVQIQNMVGIECFGREELGGRRPEVEPGPPMQYNAIRVGRWLKPQPKQPGPQLRPPMQYNAIMVGRTR